MVSYRIAGGRIRLNLKNLTDQQTYTRGFGSISVIPGTGFGAFVGFDYRF
jgi:outer membrane receptor protein involved in Fe transport